MIDASQIAPIAGTIGVPFALGGAIGYALKKIAKIAAVIVGLFVAALLYLQEQKIITVDWHLTSTIASNDLTWVYHSIAGIMHAAQAHIGIVVGGSFTMGLAIGFAKG